MNWLLTALRTKQGRAIALMLAGALAVSGIFGAGWKVGSDRAQSACETRIGEAEREAMRTAAKAAQEQRARADALAVSNAELQRIADALLSENRDDCPIDDDTRSRVLQIRPPYPDPAGSSPRP